VPVGAREFRISHLREIMKTKETAYLRRSFCCLVGAVLLALAPATVGAQGNPPPSGNALVVTISGNGVGTVSSGQPAANSIQCPGQCSMTGYDSVVLTAKAAPGYFFNGWFTTTSCPGIAPCTVSLASANQNVVAEFVSQGASASVCKDTTINACYATCSNPDTFAECVLGCGVANSNDPKACSSSCSTDKSCLNSCYNAVNMIKNCAYASGEITASCGALVLNRSTQIWQQTVHVTNTSSTEALGGLAFVLDSLASGWTLTNADGLTETSGSPYRNFGSLAPGASANVTLTFSRTGTPAFSYVTRVTANQ
jgi:hypothetical protein